MNSVRKLVILNINIHCAILIYHIYHLIIVTVDILYFRFLTKTNCAIMVVLWLFDTSVASFFGFI